MTIRGIKKDLHLGPVVIGLRNIHQVGVIEWVKMAHERTLLAAKFAAPATVRMIVIGEYPVFQIEGVIILPNIPEIGARLLVLVIKMHILLVLSRVFLVLETNGSYKIHWL